MMKLLLTGSNGFVGTHFLRLEKGARSLSEPELRRIDLLDPPALEHRIAEIDFDSVVHLAAKTYVPNSFENPRETLEVNFLGALNLLNALQQKNFHGKFLFVGTAEEYGVVDEADLPILENTPLRPRSPYAVSKVAAEALCYQYSQTSSFKVIMVRSFNHIGPGQNEYFSISGMAKQIVEIKKGLKKPILEVGDLEVTRDFTDVRDVIRAYQMLLLEGGNGEIYNVCSGREHKISELLKIMLGLENLQVELRTNPARVRPGEQRRSVGSFDKLHRLTGWEPKIPLEKTLQDILEDWKRKIP